MNTATTVGVAAVPAAVGRYEQQERCCWIGGHFAEPKEQ
jgi:hypothetical protein